MPATLPTTRVLLVDDDTIALEVAALMLSGTGAAVERAQDGEQALSRIAAVDVVLVDYQMPGISGSDVARAVRALPAPRPRVLAMSASPLPTGERALFDGFLLKPLDSERLRAALGSGLSAADDIVAPEQSLPAALDASRVRKLQALMPPDALRELYTVFVADARDRIDELERCSAVGDEEALRRSAHALKGSAAMSGVPGIAQIAGGLESGELHQQEYSKLFHEMRTACDDVERSMAGAAAPGESQ